MSGAGSGFEVQEHTADVKLHVWGATLPELFEAAAEGFYKLLGDIEFRGSGEPLRISIEAPDTVDLLHDWLAELLFRFDTHLQCVKHIAIDELTGTGLTARGETWVVDAARSRFDAEVKAVTYHGLEVVARGGRFEATVILDL